ncbi:MAG: NAD(P)-binding domain-containing protein [Planctomycetota bacterium]
MSETLSTDTLIVGAGPIGLELAVCLRHAGVDTLQIDAGQVGQTVSDYPKQTTYFSSPDRIAIAGVPLNTPDQRKATREQYLAYLHGVARQFDLPVRTFERVIAVERNPDAGRFTVTTTRATLDAARVVLAIGDMHHPRLLDIPGEDLPHVSHYLDEPHRYFRQKLLIVGGKNSAVEAALRCERAGAEVSISYRGEEFDPDAIKYWLTPEIDALIAHGQIGFHPRTVPEAITDRHVTLASVDNPDDHRELEADAVLLLTGYTQDKSLFESAGVTLEGGNRAPRHDPATMMTDVPDLYVAGTAAAGTQHAFKLYIENSHPHVVRITRSITGSPPPDRLVNAAAKTYGLPES